MVKRKVHGKHFEFLNDFQCIERKRPIPLLPSDSDENSGVSIKVLISFKRGGDLQGQ